MKTYLSFLAVGIFGAVLLTAAVIGIDCQGHGDVVAMAAVVN